MSMLLRRARGILGMGLTWSIVWSLAGALFAVAQLYIVARSHDALHGGMGGTALRGALTFAIYGFATGSLFVAILAVAERRRRLDQLKFWRTIVWGILAGAAVAAVHVAAVRLMLGGVLPDGAAVTVAAALLGALSAAATLKVAKGAATAA